MNENEQLLKRLQEAPATYNVFNWESSRKDQVKQIKNICYYPPSLLKKKGRRKSRKPNVGLEPNKQLFDLYQQSLRMSNPTADETN